MVLWAPMVNLNWRLQCPSLSQPSISKTSFYDLKDQVIELEGFLDLSVVSDLVRRLEDLFRDASEAKEESDQAAEEDEPTEDEDSD